MGLVDYPDSDVSDTEEASVPVAASTNKSTFQKVVDRSQPGKIKVSLPQTALRDEIRSDEPPNKRAKTGGGAFGGFNSFLPAPKRTGQSTNPPTGRLEGAKNGGLGAGVNLKTGATPGFARGTMVEEHIKEDTEDYEHGVPGQHPPSTNPTTTKDLVGEVKLMGKPLMFKPLSVSRKPAKKKKTNFDPTRIASTTPAIPVTPTISRQPARPKISLFSAAEVEQPASTKPSGKEYTPLLYHPDSEQDTVEGEGRYGHDSSLEEITPDSPYTQPPPAVPTPPISQSLADIAGDLQLSAAERRQLFGRQKGNASMQGATKVINFNTDQEYLRNEELRAAGEQIAHNPVRAIAPGKHSLKQLVNAAQSQKEALEESFAKGRSNRAEASSRYGW